MKVDYLIKVNMLYHNYNSKITGYIDVINPAVEF